MKFFSDDSYSGALANETAQLDRETILRNAAAYARMSTEHQQYSIPNQLDVIREYAARHRWILTKIYADEGRSGLNIEGRQALSQMISDVLTKKVNFAHILVYDVSRWGRFPDPDEAAHYEFICREAGVHVHYCAEQFDNNLSLASTIAKSLKRAMAGEYSRELSVKVFRAATRMIQLGFKQGGKDLYGLRRMMVDQTGQHKMILKPGEQKSLTTDRVIFVPGPADEIKVVRWIFESFAEDWLGPKEIARQLNERGVISNIGTPWNELRIRSMLQNEKYIGNLVYARSRSTLRSKPVPNPPEQWIRKDNVFEAIVPRELFYKARAIYQSRRRHRFTDAQMLEKLRDFWDEHGNVTRRLLDQNRSVPTSGNIKYRFGGLVNAYQRIGLNARKNYNPTELNRRLLHKTRELAAELTQKLEQAGATVRWQPETQILFINQELRVRLLLLRHSFSEISASRWIMRCRARVKPDFTMVARMDFQNEDILDYYVFPGLDPVWKLMRLGERNGASLDAYRFESPDVLLGMAARTKLKL